LQITCQEKSVILIKKQSVCCRRRKGNTGMSHADKARELFMEGYNCAQSVVLAFAEELEAVGTDRRSAARLSSSFGAGIGRMREVCGCVSGMAFILGALYGYESPQAVEEKAQHYARIQRLAGEFEREAGSMICRELLAGVTDDTQPVPEARTEAYYERRPCARLAALAGGILEQYLAEQGQVP